MKKGCVFKSYPFPVREFLQRLGLDPDDNFLMDIRFEVKNQTVDITVSREIKEKCLIPESSHFSFNELAYEVY